MSRNVVSALAGCACAMLVGNSVHADYVGIEWAALEQGQPEDIFVFGVYAVFDNPADRLLGVIGEPNNMLHIWTDSPGGYHQTGAAQLGSDLAPASTFTDIFPELFYDSFVTLGLGAGYEGESTTGLTPGWFDAVSVGFNNDGTLGPAVEGWFNGNPDNTQGAPDGDGRVMIAQLSVNDGWTTINGKSLVIGWNDAAGNTSQTPTNFKIPAPGALALLGLAGLSGARRRRA